MFIAFSFNCHWCVPWNNIYARTHLKTYW